MKYLPGKYKEMRGQEKRKSLQFVHDRLLQLIWQRNAREITKGELMRLQNNKMSLRVDVGIFYSGDENALASAQGSRFQLLS